jgi:AcrR family transcriptional regulator
VPRIVDHDARRAELVRALWEVVRSSGIHAVSVRSVAAAAGMSPSALRHYFATQDDLLAFGLTSVVERVTSRVGPLLDGLQGRPAAVAVLEQFLPLDDERRIETAVYLAFIGRSPGSPALRRIRDETDALSLRAIRLAVGLLGDAGEVSAGRDLDAEAERLYALLDGLAMHGSLMPDRYPAAALSAVLDRHLVDLRRPAAPDPGA